MARDFHPNDNDRRHTIDRERALGVRETAVLLGIAEITLRQRMSRGEAPRFFRIGRTVRFRLGDVLDYREAHTVGERLP